MDFALNFLLLPLFVVVYIAIILGIGWMLVWFLTPVAYRRWRDAARKFPPDN